MAVKIRLARTGRTHVPFYRIVAIDSRSKRNGKVLDNIGTFDPLNGTVVRFEEGLYDKWITCGAVVSDSAKKIYKLFKKEGIATPKTGVAASAEAPKAAPKKVAAKKEAAPAVEETQNTETQAAESVESN